MLLREWENPPPAPELFRRLSRRRGCFYLDSALTLADLGRYSFLGCEPYLTLEADAEGCRLTGPQGHQGLRGNPLQELHRLLGPVRHRPNAPLPFVSGAVGGISYEAGSALEGINGTRLPPADLMLPDLHFGFHDGCFAYDHVQGRAWLAVDPGSGCTEAEAMDRLEAIRGEVLTETPPPPTVHRSPVRSVESRSLSKQDYLSSVRRIRDWIAAGDVYQVNLAQRFQMPCAESAADLYLRLRDRNPAPFACYYDAGKWQAVGSSPERFLQRQGKRLETRPIKGTRPRGANPAQDAALRAALAASEKDRAELLMIVDLERNDLGRVSEFGSVHVDALYQLETHPTVFHLVGVIESRLRTGLDTTDCLRAMLPGGSITGAPKIRAMEIIAELEPVRRNFYTGNFGYLGFDGGCDLNIAIRTLFLQDGIASYHVGSGIVWDSDPEAEYQETLDKGRALREVLEQARS